MRGRARAHTLWGGGGDMPERRWVRVVGWAVVAAFGALAAAVALAPAPPGSAAGPTLLYDRTGAVFASLSPGERVPVPLRSIPLALQQATLATEDADFYDHHGVNPEAILRAALVDLRARAPVEGGSTITQQLAKVLYLTPNRTLTRKLLELVYTLRLESTRSKAQILTLYLNSINYGEGAYGIGAAAQTYFAQDVSTLDLAQSALLAGLPNAPTAYDPYVHPAAARARQAWVLHRMLAVGFITPAQAAAALAEPLHYTRGAGTPGAPAAGYFVDYVLSQIGSHDAALEAAVRRGGYRVTTTLDPALQAAADADFAQYMPAGTPSAQGVLQPQGALVAIDPASGAVRALIGGRSYAQAPYNRAINALRQPGSTFKAFLYAAALADGHTVTQRQFDGPVTYPGAGGQPYTVHDDGPYQLRQLTMREAMAISDNVVAVKWADEIGPQLVIRMARAMGITSPLQPTLPLVLGTYDVTPLELTDAYVPLANLGTAYAPWAVVSVVSATGATVWAPAPPRGRRALDPGVAYIDTSLLQSVMTDGTGSALLATVDRPVAGKTGSTNNVKDAWFVGFTPDLVAGVWVGDDQPEAMNGFGATLAGPVWAHFMADALAGLPARSWTQPADVVAVTVAAEDGLLPNATSPTVSELFLRGTQPTQVSPLNGDGGRDPGLTGLPGSQILPPLLGSLELPTKLPLVPPIPAASLALPAAGAPGSATAAP